jgi:hypothetical protein
MLLHRALRFRRCQLARATWSLSGSASPASRSGVAPAALPVMVAARRRPRNRLPGIAVISLAPPSPPPPKPANERADRFHSPRSRSARLGPRRRSPFVALRAKGRCRRVPLAPMAAVSSEPLGGKIIRAWTACALPPTEPGSSRACA